MYRGTKRRAASWLLVGALAFSALPQTAVNAAEGDTSDFMQSAYDALEIWSAGDVRNDLGLPKEKKVTIGGETKTVQIDWHSSNTAVITDTPSGVYGGGIVTRPAAGAAAAKVTLEATLSLEGEQNKTKPFTVTVTPKTANLDTDYSAGYLWTNFGVEGGYEKIFFGYSEDGLSWENLNKEGGTAKPVLANDAPGSDGGVRDPHLIRSVDGDKYWILGTDLHAEGGGAGGSGWDQLNASQNLVVWESNDLVNWSEPHLVYAGFDNAGCVWAPEAIYDDVAKDYVVYWSARDKSLAGTEQNALRVYVCRTRDFHTFTEPKVWLSEDQDTGEGVNIIDTTIAKENGKYYRFSTSDWNTVIDVSDTLDTDDVLDVRDGESQSTPNGSWKRLVTRSGSGAAGFSGIEGLTVYQLPNGAWCVMGDNQGYKAFLAETLSAGEFFASSRAQFESKFRHGTVTRLSAAEEARVLEAFQEAELPDDPDDPGDGTKEPILEYNFEDQNETEMTNTASGGDALLNGTLHGKAAVVYDEELESNVLHLDGSSGGYGEFPQGFFDGRDTMSISMDVKSELSSGNFFTLAFGKSENAYDFLRIRGTEVRNAMTVSGWKNEKEVKGSGAVTGSWQNVVIVFNGTNMKLYVDGALVSENKNTEATVSQLGEDLLGYLGKSFYSDDGYFKGSFDNIRIYDRVLGRNEIMDATIGKVNFVRGIQIGTVPLIPEIMRGTDDHTAATATIDKKTNVITSYVHKNADLTKIPVTVQTFVKGTSIKIGGKDFKNGSALDLTKNRSLTVSYAGYTQNYLIKTPKLASNPVLPGQYADPDIDYFDGKYWIYPTTDGYPGWSGTKFHAFSSEDMVNWQDEGIIMELANDDPGVNDKGIEIAVSPWAVEGSAWAPTIEKKNDKYYFYYCGKRSGGASCIGVAVADQPQGPYEDIGEPLLTVDMCKGAGVEMGQAIDPSIFTDDDGRSYVAFGNGKAAIAELNDDMVSVKSGTLRQITGLTDFRESPVITKRDGRYHFTWSCDDANSPNYHVNYGIYDGDSLDGEGALNVTYKYTLLQKDEAGNMLGTAHQSLLYFPAENGQPERCYISYHRFYTPLGIYTDGLGVHRTTCIDEVTFDEDGLMKPLAPTMKGVAPTDQFETGTYGDYDPVDYPPDPPTGGDTEKPPVNPPVNPPSGGDSEKPPVEKPVQFKITFQANGGKKLSKSSITVESGKAYGKLPTVVRSKYKFAGWYTAKSGGKKVTEKTLATANVTLYARWTKVKVPGKVAKLRVKNSAKRAMKVSFGKVKGADGYEIRYALKSNMKGAKKVNASSASKTIKKLKKGKTYYVRVKAYVKDSTGKKYYSKKDSARVKVKIKK